MRTLSRILAISLSLVVALAGVAWVFVVPRELKTLLRSWSWRDAHRVSSGYVAREPAGTRIYWEEFGKADGPPVVVLHAGLCTIEVMREQIEALAAASFRVIAIDSRGHGKSSNTALVLTYEMLTDDVVAVMDDLKIPRADVVGWSDGGNLALDLARRYPDRARRIVAFGANHTPPPDGQDAEMTRAFKEAAPDSGMFWPIRRLYEKRSPTPEKWAEFFVRERNMVFAGPNWSLEQLSIIRAPVLFINGEHDLVLRPYATAMKDTIPGARLEVIAGGTHEVPLAKPEIVNPLMLSFLKEQ